MATAVETGQPVRNSQVYAERVNPQWVRLLDLLEMNVRYERCVGAELFTADGRRIVDFLSGYCVHNVGHNHPGVVQGLQEELTRCGPAMIQTHAADLAGELAERLCTLAGGRLSKAFFASSGSEGVEAAIKFARAHTRRAGILAAEHAFHGLTCGSLSLMSDAFWKEGFGPLLPETTIVPFGSMEALESQLKSKRFAAFIVEPIQSEAGVRIPHADYLRGAEALCRRYGTLFVLDEVQTGMYRTGTFLAAPSVRSRSRYRCARKGPERRSHPGRCGADVRRGLQVGLFVVAPRLCPHVYIQREQFGDASRVGNAGRPGA